MGWLAHCTRPSALTAITASCMLLSRVSSWRWLKRTASKLSSTRRGGAIDGSGDAADFVLRSFLDAGLKIAFRDAGGDIDDALQAARAPMRGDGGDQQREEERHNGCQFQPMVDLLRYGFNIGERVSQAHRSTGDGRGHIKKRNANGGAAALVAAHSSRQSSRELRTGGVVFHARRMGFGIGQDLARGIDDGNSGPGSLPFLGGDVGERVSAVSFDAMREKQSLLSEIAFNFGA